MTENPYASSQETQRVIEGSIQWETVVASRFPTFISTERFRETVRQKAKQVIDAQIGAENVVSVVENNVWPFSITVWYRT